MNTKKFIRYFLICFCFLISCKSKTKLEQNAISKSQIIISTDSSIKIYFIGNNKYITFDTLQFLIPTGINISPENIYQGIFELNGNFLKRHKSLISNDFVFLSTSEDLGKAIRSYLYVFDIRNKSLIKDTGFKRDFLYSSAGIFVIDPKIKRILSIDKPQWYDAKQATIIPASIYYVKGNYFQYQRNVFKYGEEIPSDSSLLLFFNNSMDNKNKEILELPINWWKTDHK